MNILLFKEDADAKLPEDARVVDAVECISCEALNGLCKDEVDLFLFALTDHPQEFCAFFRRCASDAFIGCCTKRTNKFTPYKIPGVGSPSEL